MKSIKYGRVYGETLFGTRYVNLDSFNPYLPTYHFQSSATILEEFESRIWRHKYDYKKCGIRIDNAAMKEIELRECRDIIRFVVYGDNMFFPRIHSIEASLCDNIIADIDNLGNISSAEFAEMIRRETRPEVLIIHVGASFASLFAHLSAPFIIVGIFVLLIH